MVLPLQKVGAARCEPTTDLIAAAAWSARRSVVELRIGAEDLVEHLEAQGIDCEGVPLDGRLDCEKLRGTVAIVCAAVTHDVVTSKPRADTAPEQAPHRCSGCAVTR